MIQKTCVSLGALLLSGFLFQAAAKPTPRTEILPTNHRLAISSTASSAVAPRGNSYSFSRDTVRNLLADGFSLEERIRASRAVKAREAEAAAYREALEYPAIDLYGENTWNDAIDPFRGSVADIPAVYDIDCSGFVQPLDKKMVVTSHFGYRRQFGRNHYGTDLNLNTGDTVRSCFDGKVRIRGYERGGYGHYIVVRHPNGLETVYGHLSRPLAKSGDIVLAGEAIGLGGSTGRSTGPHLHLEMRFMGIALNPAHIIDFASGQPQRDVYTFRHGRRGGSSNNVARNTSSKKAYSSNKQQSAVTYRVRKGDSLYRIAQKNGTSVTELCRLNRISSRTKLQPGQSLRVK